MRDPPSPAGGFDNGLIMVVVNFTKRPMGTIGDDPNFYPSQIKHLFIPPYIHSTSTLTVFHGADKYQTSGSIDKQDRESFYKQG